MDKKGLFIFLAILFAGTAIILGSRLEREIHFSDEILAGLPGCLESKAMFDAGDRFSEAQFEKMRTLAEKCKEAQLNHLESSPSPEGVTFEYGLK